MPHKEGHWGYKARKSFQSGVSDAAKGVVKAGKKVGSEIKKRATDDKGISSLWYGEEKRKKDKLKAKQKARKKSVLDSVKGGTIRGGGKLQRKNRNAARRAAVLAARRNKNKKK